jgi:autotransporter-associated beta strand protein
MKQYIFGSLLACLFLAVFSFSASAQRIQQPLGRGVVAVNNGSSVLVAWRKLAQEAENTTYNVYRRAVGGTTFTKVNSTPITKTNFSTTTSAIPLNTEIAVTTIVDGVESEPSEAFTLKSQAFRSVFMNINFSNTLSSDEYVVKFVWPADLDGDGEYDYVCDRLSTTDVSTRSHKIEGYLRDGTYLWTIDVGPNVYLDRGQDDMCLAYDMNCDGRAEVVIKSSDGTRFWDHTNMTWGKYLLGSTNGDTDGDGIIDYNAQNVKNPPFYITVVNGLTGEEMNSIEMPYAKMHDGSDQYSRTNKSAYMSDGYNLLNGHMGVCYLDGIHPSVVMEYLDRTTNGTHHNYVSAWGYDFVGATATNWKEKFTWSRNDKTPWPAEFHSIRIGDVDLDGKDEMLEGGYTLDDNGTMLFSAGIGHGDRFRVGDINPDRPGLETYAIQQSSLLGQLLYDSSNGKHLKDWYLSSAADVGRGECMDVDATHKGYEIFSTMPNLYDCAGDVITSGDTPFPTEGVWWDGELDREMLSAPDGNGFNAMVTKYDQTRLIQMAKESGWTVNSTYGVRPMFFGDIIGDWRDEVILKKGNDSSSTGIIGYTTDYATNYSIYCLQQDPAYRMQCTTRGYYQSPMTDFYLGYGMPTPPLPPSMVTDVRWGSGSEWNANGSNFVTFDLSASTGETNGKSVLFDISGSNSSAINISGTQTPKTVYVMSPLGHNYTWNVSGSLSGPMDLWKSMNGTLTVNGNLAYTGKTIVSEGTLQLEGNLTGPLSLRAKGTLAGNAVLNDTTLFEGALNYEGCRLSPGTSNAPFGTITSNKSMALPGNVYIEENLQTEGTVKCDLLKVNGNLTLLGANTFTIVPSETKPNEGEYVLAQCTGTLTADVSKIVIRGLVGLNYSVKTDGKQITLKIAGSRAPASDVMWTGATNGTWDYKTANFSLGGQNTTFVAGDEITFGDEPSQRNITIGDLMPVAGVKFVHQSDSYTLNGDGGISGTGGITKTGSGTLYLNNTKSDFTGATILSGGTTVVKALGEAGTASSIGAASAEASNFQLSKCTLTINNANTSTNRGVMLTDTINMNVASGFTTLKGVVTGTGTLLKTGTGQLSLTYGTNTYSGGTIVRGGTLAQGAWNTTFGTLGGNLTLAGGTLVVMANNGTSTVPNLQYKLHIADGTTNYINGAYRFRIQGSIDGSGTLTINFPYVRGDVSANWSAFSGTLNATGVQMRLNAAQDMSQATLNLGDATNLGHYASGSGTQLTTLTTKIGALKSTSATSNVTGGIFNVGYNNQDATFAGLLNCNAVNKYGTGTWTLTNGASSAPLSIYGGTICAANASGTLTTGNIIVYGGGTLLGTGITKNVIVQKGGIVDAGTGTLTTGTLTVGGNLTLNAGATLRVRVRTVTNSKYNIGGTLTMNGDTLLLDNLGRTYKNGDELTLFTGNGTRSGKYILKPAVPAEGFVWDDSSLLSDGILRVAATDGIAHIGVNCMVDVYSVGGTLLRTNEPCSKALNGLPHGTYIVKPNGQNGTYKVSR